MITCFKELFMNTTYLSATINFHKDYEAIV